MLEMMLGLVCRGGGCLYISESGYYGAREEPLDHPLSCNHPASIRTRKRNIQRSLSYHRRRCVRVERLFAVAVHLPENQPSEWVDEQKAGDKNV
jgi:hypothetical protein